MIAKKINAAGEWIENHLRRMCGAITPDKRVVVVVAMFLLFAGLSLYFTISSIYRFGMGAGERMQMRHIERLELELRHKQSQLDSVKLINGFDYERETE